MKEVTKRAMAKVEASEWRPYADLSSDHILNSRTWKQYMHAVIAAGETEVERKEIEEDFCYGLMTLNTSGLRGV